MDHIKFEEKKLTAVDSCKSAFENPYKAITKLFFKLDRLFKIKKN